MYLHSEDLFMPSDIYSHVVHTTPYLDFQPIAETDGLTLNRLSVLNRYGSNVYLTSRDNVTTDPHWLRGETPDASGALHNATACVVVVVEHASMPIVDVFYFYFYSYNEGADIEQVLPPLNRILPDAKPGDHFGDHVGDWEHNMIRFDDGRPTGIYFSAHGGGEACDWADDNCLSKQGDRPIVYSARGSHANYPKVGAHVHDEALIDVADKGRLWDPIKPAYFYTYDHARDLLAPAEPTTEAPTDWFHFSGAWGDKKYRDSDPRQKAVPYFGLKKYNDGPTGPKFKHLVRHGLFPDVWEKKTVMKILVGWYMSLYGCCLAGYPPWVVIMVVLFTCAVLSALLVFVVKRARRHLVQRIRTTRRRQTGGDATTEGQIPILDMERADDDEDL